MEQQTFYEFFGIPTDADEQEIKKAYHRLVRIYYPEDSQPENVEDFVIVNTIYKTLINPERRRAYDKFIFEEVEVINVSKDIKKEDEATILEREKFDMFAHENIEFNPEILVVKARHYSPFLFSRLKETLKFKMLKEKKDNIKEIISLSNKYIIPQKKRAFYELLGTSIKSIIKEGKNNYIYIALNLINFIEQDSINFAVNLYKAYSKELSETTMKKIRYFILVFADRGIEFYPRVADNKEFRENYDDITPLYYENKRNNTLNKLRALKKQRFACSFYRIN